MTGQERPKPIAAGLFGGAVEIEEGTIDAVRVAEATTLEGLRARVRSGFELKPRELRLLRELEAKEAGADVVQTVEALADRMGVAKRTVLRWIKEGLPRRADGLFDVAEVKAWRAKGFDAGRELDADAPEDDGEGVEYWKRIKEEEQAKLARLKRMKEEGALIERDEVDRREARLLAIVKAALLAFPRALPPLLEGLDRQQMEARIDEEVRSVLERMKTNPQAKVAP